MVDYSASMKETTGFTGPENPTPQRRLSRRASFRERFWTRRSANYYGDDDIQTPDHGPQTNIDRRSAYVPMNAASGFSKTVPSSRNYSQKSSLATMKEERERKYTSTKSSRRSSAQACPTIPEVGHLYVPAAPSAQMDDFADFIAAAEDDDRTRRLMVSKRNSSGSYSFNQDSGYSSSGQGGGHDREREMQPSSLPVAPATAVPRTLSRKLSHWSFGLRIAEYIRPAGSKTAAPTPART